MLLVNAMLTVFNIIIKPQFGVSHLVSYSACLAIENNYNNSVIKIGHFYPGKVFEKTA